MKFIFLVLFLCTPVISAFSDTNIISKSVDDDQSKLSEYQQRCQMLNTLVVKNQFKLECFSNYHHYYPTTVTRASGKHVAIKIAEYNLLHPGTSKALFKDYSLVAKVANTFDVFSGLEVLATVGHDEANNQAVLNYLRNTNDVKMASALYRVPGYYRLLMELKKLDPSWGLILSPRGDSALEGSVEEMVAYFYRGNLVTPVINPHCQEYKDIYGGNPFACLINLREAFMGRDVSHYYSRRPFMASFQSGSFKFTMVSNHVVFGYGGDEAAQKQLLDATFGTDDLNKIGVGINLANFARFAEIKNTLDFMNRYVERYHDNNIMFVGDTNLVPNIPFWADILNVFPGSSLLINEPTTVSPVKFSIDNKETNGVANSYDHFILNQKTFYNCTKGEVYNYYRSEVNADIERVYGMRNTPGFKLKSAMSFSDDEIISLGDPVDIPAPDETGPLKLDYPLTPLAENKMDDFVKRYSYYLNALYTVKNNTVVKDDFQIPERLDGLKTRIFLKQLTNQFYYRFYQELLSDHFPVSISCYN